MFDKSFAEMRALDVSQHVQKRDGIDYLPWGTCKDLLHQNGAEVVMFYPVPGPDGSTLRKSDTVFKDKNGVENRCYEVLVHIQIDNMEWETTYPVMNGNNPVRDNSMNQLRVHNAVRRGFVKGVAERTGLGFGLWVKGDDLHDEPEDLSKHSLAKCKQRLQEEITAKFKMMPAADFYARLGSNKRHVSAMLGYYDELMALERAIVEMRP